MVGTFQQLKSFLKFKHYHTLKVQAYKSQYKTCYWLSLIFSPCCSAAAVRSWHPLKCWCAALTQPCKACQVSDGTVMSPTTYLVSITEQVWISKSLASQQVPGNLGTYFIKYETVSPMQRSSKVTQLCVWCFSPITVIYSLILFILVIWNCYAASTYKNLV